MTKFLSIVIALTLAVLPASLAQDPDQYSACGVCYQVGIKEIDYICNGGASKTSCTATCTKDQVNIRDTVRSVRVVTSETPCYIMLTNITLVR